MNISDFQEVLVIRSLEHDEITSIPLKVSRKPVGDHKDLNAVASYSPAKGDVIYFLPGCNVPRMKVRDYCDTHGTRVTNDPEKANIVFFGPSTLGQFFTKSRGSYVQKAAYVKWLQVAKDEDSDFVDVEIEKALASESDVVFAEWDVLEILFGNDQCPWLGEPVSIDLDSDELKAQYYATVDQDQSEEFSKLAKSDGKLYSQDDIIVGLGTRVIDAELYKQLDELLSSQTSDAAVAVEIMANCNPKASISYLLLLINEHGQRISTCKSSKHVNFKAVLDYLDVDVNGGGYNPDELVEFLIRKGCDTEENLDILTDFIYKEANEAIQGNGLKRFKVTKVELVEREQGESI